MTHESRPPKETARGAGRRNTDDTPRSWSKAYAELTEADVLSAVKNAEIVDLVLALDRGSFPGDHSGTGFACPRCDRWTAEVPSGTVLNARPSERHEGTPSTGDTVVTDDGLRRRDEGMASALHASDVRWKVAAENAMTALARSGAEFTVEHLRDRVGVLASSPDAFGALVGRATRRDEIACVGVTTSTRPERHGGLIRVWQGT
jgi:hypothetical protein